jgi:tRNA (cmo5U34)-methyltransferase
MSSTKTPHDSLYAEPLGKINGFTFDESVVSVFPDMLRRSVPGYQTIITQSGSLAEKYAQDNSNIYDLGCSLGATTIAMRNRVKAKNCTIIAIDNSAAMVAQFADILAKNPGTPKVELIHGDMSALAFERASVVTINFTLQFIAPEQRQNLIDKIYQAMLPGAILILSEKICFEDSCQQALHTQMYHSFKRANGYSDLEISQKRTALENVLIADSLPTHKARLQQAGFSSSEVWFQCFNFASIMALK